MIMEDDIFTFKKFKINQSQCAMKIGTDSVLLGSWVKITDDINTVLDIGAGTGVLSLMVAQRSSAEVIDAVEIENNAYEQCVANFENSDWGDRLFCYHASFYEFYEEIEDTYDLIVSNPPFYENNGEINNSEREIARFNNALPYEELIYGVSKLLSKYGRFNLVIPYEQRSKLNSISKNYGLYPQRILNIKGSPESPFKRCLIEYQFKQKALEEKNLIIEVSRHNYTSEYKELTKNFYLNM